MGSNNNEETIIDESNLDQVPKKVKLKNLSDKQKSTLQAIGSGFGGIALGAALMTLIGAKSQEDTDDAPPSNSTNRKGDNDFEVPIYGDAPFSDVDTSDMPFSEAFAAARGDVGPGGFFEWNGETYNTYYAEEWQALSPEEQQDFFASLDPNYTNDDIVSEEEILDILNDDEVEEFDGMDQEDIVIIDDSDEIDSDETGGEVDENVVIVDDDESDFLDDDPLIDDSDIGIDDLG